jgi:hypothetical protein
MVFSWEILLWLIVIDKSWRRGRTPLERRTVTAESGKLAEQPLRLEVWFGAAAVNQQLWGIAEAFRTDER